MGVPKYSSPTYMITSVLVNPLTGVETNGALVNGLAVGWFGGCWVGWLAGWLGGCLVGWLLVCQGGWVSWLAGSAGSL